MTGKKTKTKKEPKFIAVNDIRTRIKLAAFWDHP